MLLGIVLHATHPFTPAMKWYIAAPNQSIAFAYLYYFIHAFRMPGFFMMAGFFAALMLMKRSSGVWFQSRLERLGVPLLFGVIFVVPFESVALALPRKLNNGGVDAQTLFSDAIQRHWQLGLHLVSHLWFILDLLLISAVFAAIWPSVRRPALVLFGQAIDLIFARPIVAGSAAVLALAVYLLAIEVLAYSRVGTYLTFIGDAPMWGVFDVCRILYYAPFFLLGAVLCENRAFLMWFIRPSPLSWAAGLVAVLCLIAVHVHLPAHGRIGAAFSGVAGILLVRVCLQVTYLFLNKRSRLVQHGVASSYTIYIVHEPILLFVAVVAIWFGMDAFSGFFFVFIATTILAATTYWITSRMPLAPFLLNGIRRSDPLIDPSIGNMKSDAV